MRVASGGEGTEMKCRLITWQRCSNDKQFPDGKYILGVKEFQPFTASGHLNIECEHAMHYADLFTNSDVKQNDNQFVTMEFVKD
jgi:hypothetical protein